jgi:hypothetical protein
VTEKAKQSRNQQDKSEQSCQIEHALKNSLPNILEKIGRRNLPVIAVSL